MASSAASDPFFTPTAQYDTHRGRQGREGRMTKFLRTLWHDESGQDLAEYTMLVVLIAVVALLAVQTLGTTITAEIDSASTQLFTP